VPTCKAVAERRSRIVQFGPGPLVAVTGRPPKNASSIGVAPPGRETPELEDLAGGRAKLDLPGLRLAFTEQRCEEQEYVTRSLSDFLADRGSRQRAQLREMSARLERLHKELDSERKQAAVDAVTQV